jgi:hypothetical protein
MPDPVSLYPGDALRIGHAVADADINLGEGESQLVVALPEPDPPPPPPEPLPVYLVEPIGDTRMQELRDGDRFLKPFAMEVAPDFPVGSLKFSLDGSPLRIENAAPFAPFGDRLGDFAPADITPGDHELRVWAYDGKAGGGKLLSERTLAFEVTPDLPDPPDPPPPDPPGGSFPDSVLEVLDSKAIASLKLPDGWKERGADWFDKDIDLGEWGWQSGPFAFPRWTRGDVLWRPTNFSYLDSSGRGRYDSIHSCFYRDNEFIQRVGGVRDGKRIASRPLPMWSVSNPTMETISRSRGFRFELVARFPTIVNGMKCAYLSWGHARINQPGYAEYDFPEMKFGPGPRGNGFAHNEGTVGGQDTVRLEHDISEWHLYTLEYQAEGFRGHPTGRVRFILDGETVLNKTTHISDRDLYLAPQIETYLKHDPVLPSGPPSDVVWRLARLSELA